MAFSICRFSGEREEGWPLNGTGDGREGGEAEDARCFGASIFERFASPSSGPGLSGRFIDPDEPRSGGVLRDRVEEMDPR